MWTLFLVGNIRRFAVPSGALRSCFPRAPAAVWQRPGALRAASLLPSLGHYNRAFVCGLPTSLFALSALQAGDGLLGHGHTFAVQTAAAVPGNIPLPCLLAERS